MAIKLRQTCMHTTITKEKKLVYEKYSSQNVRWREGWKQKKIGKN